MRKQPPVRVYHPLSWKKLHPQMSSKTTFKTGNNGVKSAADSRALSSEASIEFSQTCSVCADIEPKFWSISSCSHSICWICSLRLRSLYGSKACPICKSHCDFVFIGKGREFKVAEEFFNNPKRTKWPLNETLSIAFENEVVRSSCEALLLFQCPFNHSNKSSAAQSGCSKHFRTKNELKRHVQNGHDLQVCEICLEYKKCFTVELPLYNRTSLQKHQRDINHPRCQVCSVIFYSEDELAEHCRDAHELCHICQRTGRPNRHFLNYSKLEEHFGKEHYLCPESLCRELKFVVFENEFEYKAHQAEVHLSHQKLQRSQQRQLQRLNISFGSGNGNGETFTTSGSTASPPTNPSASPLKLTSDQRNQIATNLIYGEVTDDLANRLQSLSLYQNRNDEFIESVLRATLHFNQKQVQDLFEAAREFQGNKLSGTEFILRIEKLMPSADSRVILLVASGLSELQLDEMRRHKLNVAISEYRDKSSSFPELSRGSTVRSSKNTSNSIPWGKAPSPAEDEKEMDPFGFARKNPRQQSGFNKPSRSGVKVLQILKPAALPVGPSTPKSTDPSRNPAVLLSQLAGGPGPRKTRPASSPASTVKMKTFSTAAIDSVPTIPPARKETSVDEGEFPKLGSVPSHPSDTGSIGSVTSASNPASAFLAPSDRDQLDSFTLGPDASTDDSAVAPGKKDKRKKLVFRYGQKWDV